MKLENMGNKTEITENDNTGATYGGYSYVFDYDMYDQSEEERERVGVYRIILAMIAVFTLSVLCVAAVIIVDIIKNSAWSESSSISQGEGPAVYGLTSEQIVSRTSPYTVGVCVKKESDEKKGTGIVITSDGYIVTSDSLLENTEIIQVSLEGGKMYTASVCGRDPLNDIALLKIEANGLTSANISSEPTVSEGDTVLSVYASASGQSMGVENGTICSVYNETVTASGDGREMYYEVIKTSFSDVLDCAGAPLVDKNGSIVGIMFDGEDGELIALPVSTVLPIVRDMMADYGARESEGDYYGSEKIWGMIGKNVTDIMSTKYNLPQGVFVGYLDNGSILKTAGVKRNDIIVAFNLTKVGDCETLDKLCKNAADGENVVVTVYRNGHYYKISFTNK